MQESEAIKQLAGELSQRIDGGSALTYLQFLCGNAEKGDDAFAEIWTGPFSGLKDDILGFDDSGSRGQRTVAIWQEDADSGDFVRSRQHIDLWRFCADVERIPKKGQRKRIVFLGESVARGFFFSPLYGSAHALDTQLNANGTPVEIVDLAQSNCGAWWLTHVAKSAAALEPDALVVFAGNNWRARAIEAASADCLSAYGDDLKNGDGVAGLMAEQRARAAKDAEATVRKLAEIAEEMDVPLIFIIPEINLADWMSCPAGSADVPLMDTSDTSAWIDAYNQAQRAMACDAAPDAESFANEAIRIDGETSSASLELLAKAKLRQSNSNDASHVIRKSRDVADDTRVLPGILSVVADTIERVGEEVGASIVDLRKVFKDHYPGEMPGRKQFLDYCHLNAEGTRVAMSATAQVIENLLFDKATPFDRLLGLAPLPTNEQEGWAHILAGIHNAHWGQDEDICRHHYHYAVKRHPELRSESVPKLFDSFRHGVPSVLVEPFQDIVKNRIATTYLMGYALVSRGLINEFSMLEKMAAEFPELQNTPIDPDFVLGDARELDLLSDHWAHLMDRNRWFRRSYKACYEPASDYQFVFKGDSSIMLGASMRIPDAIATGEVIFQLNGVQIGAAMLDERWHEVVLDVPASAVVEGLNKLTIVWPNITRRDVRRRQFEHFVAGQPIDVRRHFGQLQSLVLSCV